MKSNKLLVFMAIGFELVALVGVGLWLGTWVDQRYSTGGAGLMVGMVVALVAWLVHLVSLVRQVQSSDE